MTIIVENVSEKFLPSMKAFTKAINATCKVQQPNIHTLDDSKAMQQIRADFDKMPETRQNELCAELDRLLGECNANPAH